ncbi:hypothetical protein HW423_10665 [Aerococcaceae bacterium INB8]|uniref:Uncharacterized protein n=1 Tax=Ruoffia halotolerans TaxID=2748684 RepID=A0A839A9P2_9LACT|nr:hypothetical protein [Ruoffia halotolerans]MBA5730235.1 hypothetical protein [Ruoffia halotolerans]
MITYAKTDASILPEAFEDNLEGLFQNKCEDSGKTMKILKSINTELQKVVEWIIQRRKNTGSIKFISR